MALVQCPECASQVSDQATACPKCGYPLTVKPQPVNLAVPAGITAQTGTFWRCASCGKHVPNRQNTCVCGAARPEAAAGPVMSRGPVVTITPQFSTIEDRGSSAPWAVAVVLLGGLVLAGLFYASKNAGELPKAGVVRDEPTAPRGPETYFLPAAAGSPSTQQPSLQSGASALSPAEQVEMAARQSQQKGQAPGNPAAPSLPEAQSWIKDRFESEERRVTWQGCSLDIETTRGGSYARWVIPMKDLEIVGTRVESEMKRSQTETSVVGSAGQTYSGRDSQSTLGSARRDESAVTEYTLILKANHPGAFAGTIGSEVRLYVESQEAGESVRRALSQVALLCGARKPL